MPAPLCLRELVRVRHSSSSGFGTRQRKETKNNIEIAYFLYRGLEVFPILIPQFKLAMGIRKAR